MKPKTKGKKKLKKLVAGTSFIYGLLNCHLRWSQAAETAVCIWL